MVVAGDFWVHADVSACFHHGAPDKCKVAEQLARVQARHRDLSCTLLFAAFALHLQAICILLEPALAARCWQ
jgi:hypothetical protein